MATQQENVEANDIGISPIYHLTKPEDIEEEGEDEDEDEEEDRNWDDWEVEDDNSEEASASNPQLRCLFCDNCYPSCSSLFEHCASVHGFDFREIKKALKLDFYGCFKLINYVRSQVSEYKCWSCGVICLSKEEFQSHVHMTVNFDTQIFPWNDDKYLKPFLEDDALLYSFGEDDDDDDDEDGDAMSVDKEELDIGHINIHDDFVSDRTLMIPCENRGKRVTSSSDEDMNTEKPSERLTLNGPCRVSGEISSLSYNKNESCTYPSTNFAADEIKNINKNYFGAYGSFGIHREMISDKSRTDAYRQAILENPSLVRNAVVMDVGCGTGILSLFAAQSGASKVVAVEASEKMVAVATQIAKDNDLLWTGISSEISHQNGVIEVVPGMIEDLHAGHIQPHSVDVLLSEWMGYCLLYESMLSSVLFARDKWLKPGGAILPDTATMFVAGFGREGTSLPFWENVYGFNMSCIGQEIVEDAAHIPIIDVIDSCNIVSTTDVLQRFDLVTMQTKDMDFTAEVELEPKLATSPSNSTSSKIDTVLCYGLVLWFETGFTERFCREKPAILSTSPYDPNTHWSQTILTFREPIAMGSSVVGMKSAAVGTNDCPAVRIRSRISIVRATQHRSIDISMELTAVGPDGKKRDWPAQLFSLK